MGWFCGSGFVLQIRGNAGFGDDWWREEPAVDSSVGRCTTGFHLEFLGFHDVREVGEGGGGGVGIELGVDGAGGLEFAKFGEGAFEDTVGGGAGLFDGGLVWGIGVIGFELRTAFESPGSGDDFANEDLFEHGGGGEVEEEPGLEGFVGGAGVKGDGVAIGEELVLMRGRSGHGEKKSFRLEGSRREVVFWLGRAGSG